MNHEEDTVAAVARLTSDPGFQHLIGCLDEEVNATLGQLLTESDQKQQLRLVLWYQCISRVLFVLKSAPEEFDRQLAEERERMLAEIGAQYWDNNG